MEDLNIKKENTKRYYTNILIGLAGPVLAPIVHLAIQAKLSTSRPKHLADISTCECTCWDTLFKGQYENSPHPGYKHVYFNLTYSTALIWILTIVSAVGFYETLKYLAELYQQRKLHIKMFVLLCFSIYPHYYSWWGYFNAFNDLFYKQLLHQFIFSSTELLSTIAVVLLCNKDAKNSDNKYLMIYFVAVFHILCASADQFLENVIFSKGKSHQQSRDIMFMLSDVVNLAYSLVMLHRATLSNDSTNNAVLRRAIISLFALAIVCTVIVKNL